MTPTDNEIDGILCNHWPAFRTLTISVQRWVRDAVREALAKWGTPPAGEPVAWIRLQPPYKPDVYVQRHMPRLDGEPDQRYKPLVYRGPAPPVREPLDVIELMRVVMKADEETRGFALRGTTNWAAHIGKAVQNAAIGIKGEPHADT